MRMYTYLIILALYFDCALQAVDTNHHESSKSSQKCSHLYLLNVQAYPDNKPFAGWDRGLDLIPGGHLGAEQINNNSNILQDYQLMIIDINAEACGRNILNKGLVNFYRELIVSNSPCIVGVIGMVCSSQTNVFAPLAGHPNIGYIQTALSVSPRHRNVSELPYLFHTISSSSVFNKAAIALMKAFNWRRVGVVHDSLGLYFRNTAHDFVHSLHEYYPSAEIVTRIPIKNLHNIFPKIFTTINDLEVRINYWVVSHDQGSFSLCEAQKRRFLWPGYVYIMRFLDLNNLLHASTKTKCSKEEILEALEGVFLLEYRLSVDDTTQLYSGWSYGDFRRRYVESLWKNAVNRSDHVEENIYANSLYDQVWTFALAINASLSVMTPQNLSFGDYRIKNTRTISEILKGELKRLQFQGASGWIEFNEQQEVPSFIDIFQVRNGTPIPIGFYDTFAQNISFTEYFPEYMPGDTFETLYRLLPSWLGGLMLTTQAVLFCAISINMALLIRWREESEIKASSLILSMLIIIGCFLLCVAPILIILPRMIIIHNIAFLTILCNITLWIQWIGLDLIFATLFLRLLRVHHIFKVQKQHISKYWLDKYLFFYVLLICTGIVCLLGLQTITDYIHPEAQREYITTATPPYYMVTVQCNSSTLNLWISIFSFYSGVLLLLVMFLAIQTRHIKKDDYKDTKKVIFFIFLVVIAFTITTSLWVVFFEAGIHIGANVCEWLAQFAIVVICQACLFAPKIIPLVVNKLIYIRNEGRNVKRKLQTTNRSTL